MEQIGFSLIDQRGTEVAFWGDAAGQTRGAPDFIVLPNGDHVHCPSVGETYGGCRLVPRWLEFDVAPSITVSETQVVVRRQQPVPRMISDRQFFQQLAAMGVVTDDEALAAVGPGTLPAALAALIAGLPEDQQFGAKMLLVGAVQFDRQHPMVTVLGQAFGWTSDQIDDLWRAASKL